MLYTFARFIFFLFFKMFFRLKIVGRENFPMTGPVIVAPNHASFLDPIIVGVGAPRKLSYLARDTLFRFRPFAKALKWAHVSPIKRERGDVNAFKAALSKLKQGEPLLIFPEGTRSKDGNLQEPKSGIGFLQNNSRAVILPCYVKGSLDAWSRYSRFPRPNRVSVYFGRPLNLDIEFSSNKKELYLQVAREVMRSISELKKNAS